MAVDIEGPRVMGGENVCNIIMHVAPATMDIIRRMSGTDSGPGILTYFPAK
jgi:hypothetical protein